MSCAAERYGELWRVAERCEVMRSEEKLVVDVAGALNGEAERCDELRSGALRGNWCKTWLVR